MTGFKVGDIVSVTKGDPDTPGYDRRVRTVVSGGLDAWEIDLHLLRTYERAGWTVELIERPKPPLPTKPNTLGWAMRKGSRCLARHRSDGEWELYDDRGWYKDCVLARDLDDFAEVVLIPKELADQITAWADDEDGDRAEWYADTLLQKIADHLKGQDDE